MTRTKVVSSGTKSPFFLFFLTLAQAGSRGTLDHISIRILRLRHHRRFFHTITFGKIRLLSGFRRERALGNLERRGFYDTDMEKAGGIIKTVGQELTEHPEQRNHRMDRAL